MIIGKDDKGNTVGVAKEKKLSEDIPNQISSLGHFEDHLGYDGVMLGLPDKGHQLEFTQHIDKTPLPEPTKENLLVFYYDSPEEYQKANDRMRRMCILPVMPENPYWIRKGETYEDPDRWRVVLFNGVYR